MATKIVLGGGCFWCLEAAYRLVTGITQVTVGYAGGYATQPTYDQVSQGDSGHAEVVALEFDPTKLSLDQLLGIFWTIHDPTTPNAQGADIGPQYRSLILYTDDSQTTVIARSIDAAQQLFDRPIVTEVKPLDKFYPAESEHQAYFDKHPEAAYCQIVINPKLAKLRRQLAELLK